MERSSEINTKKVLLMLMTSQRDITACRRSWMDTGDGYISIPLVKKPVHAILLIFKQVKHQYNLQYFSYPYHHYNEHHISKFWQVHNLRLPFHYLPKFGKYVPWSCLLLAKIYILASMFIGRVCYLPKFTFWQVCSFVVFV